MKRTIIMALAVMGTAAANAQINTDRVLHQNRINSHQVYSTDVPGKPASHRSGAKTTSFTIATETFGTGTDTTLPAGWTSGIINGTGAWHWSDWASTSVNTMGLMYSTTAADGWMIFDADSINNDCSCAPSAWLQSPAYNCTGHTTVRLNFEEYYGHVQDTTEVWVSTDPTFATYTVYPISSNDAVMWGSTTANVALIHLNITATAAGHPAVYIRYVYYGESYYDLSWMIDDMSLTELEPHDAGISGSFMLAPDPTAYNGSIFNTPLVFVDSFVPGTLLSNYGYSNETNVPVAAHIYNGISSVYSQTGLFPTLPENTNDTPMFLPKFKPTSTGSYTCALNTALTSDADSTNNPDTVRFNVTDTTWMQNDTVVATNYFVNMVAGTFPGSPASSSMMGTRFDVPSSSVGDTISGFGVAFSPITTPTGPLGKVSVQLYSIHKGETTWTYRGTSVAKPITAADTSSFTAIKWCDFRIDTAASGGVAPFILQPGTTYAAMLQLDHVTTNILVFASLINPIPGMTGGFAITDTSNNDGSHTLHYSPFDTVFSQYVPFVRMYSGNVPLASTGINNVTQSIALHAAYPDPANTIINIPVVTITDETITVTLSNIAGRAVKSKTIHATGGAETNVTFRTDDLPEGVYNYSITQNGAHGSGSIIIAH